MFGIVNTVALLVILHYASGAYSVTASFKSAVYTYSIGDTTTLRCHSVSDRVFFSPNAIQKWYKSQQDTWILVGQKNAPAAPFSADRFVLDFIYEEAQLKDGNLDLTISNIGIADSGHYRCVLENGDEEELSDPVTLFVQPDDTANSVMIDTELEEIDEKYKCNVEAHVSCKGSTNTNIAEVDLAMIFNNQDVTNNFQWKKRVDWVGDVEGLKVPTTHVELFSDDYLPDKTGESMLSCKLSFGVGADQKELAINNIVVVRDETAHLECWSNVDDKVTIGQTDVSLTCAVKGYSGDTQNLNMKWEFFDKNCTEGTEVAMYSTNGARYHRRAEKVGQDFRLTILRVLPSMTDCGGVAKYTATLLQGITFVDDPIAFGTVEIWFDNTQSYLDNGAGATSVALNFLLASILVHSLL